MGLATSWANEMKFVVTFHSTAKRTFMYVAARHIV